MPVCFGLQEFAIVMGLRYHRVEELLFTKKTPCKRSKEREVMEKLDGLFHIARRGYKASNLLTDLMDKIIPKQYGEQLCVVWFVHSVILERHVNKVMDYPEEVSHPRMFRWLSVKNNTKIKEVDLFNSSDDAVHLLQVVHPWIVPADEDSLMNSYITLGHVDTIVDPTVDLIRKELAGATAIRRSVRQGQPNVMSLHDQPTKANLGASYGGVFGVGGRHANAAPLMIMSMLKLKKK
ncbi:hypothetical protein FXO37_24718 [Capsicum annuum]|nr:hypothetical protein FXO37_24718 [Capsicum annuum]